MAIGPIGSALIGGGIKLLGGLFGSKKKKSNTVDYVALRNNAEKAGFNPLTALRNGGAAGFTTTSSPGLTSGELLADALGAGYQSWFNAKQNERDIERDQIEKDLMRAELHQIQQQTAIVRDRDFGFSIPQVTSTNGATENGQRPVFDRSYYGIPQGALSRGWTVGSDRADIGGVSDRQPVLSDAQLRSQSDIPSVRAGGVTLVGTGGTSSAQTFEDAFGEHASVLAAPLIALDMGVGTTMKWGRDAYGAAKGYLARRDKISKQKMRDLKAGKRPRYDVRTGQPPALAPIGYQFPF